MDIKKLIIVFCIAAIAITAIIFLMSSDGETDKMELHIGIIENEYVDDYADKLADILTQVFIERGRPIEVSFFLYTSSKTAKTRSEIQIKPADNEKMWEFRFRNELKGLLSDSSDIQLTNENANEQIQQFVKQVLQGNDDKSKIYFLTGSFPKCYDEKSAKELAANLPKQQADNPKKPMFYWCVLDVRKNENNIFNALESRADLNLLDKRISFPKSRECVSESFSQVYGMFFNKLNEEQADYFLNELRIQNGRNFVLRIWNDGKLNNDKILISDDENIISEAKKKLSLLEKGKWHSINFLMKQSINFFEQLPDSVNKRLYIVGNMPPEGKGNQLDAENWKQLKAIKNLKVKFLLPFGSKDNATDKVFQFGLRHHKIIDRN